MSSRAVDLTRFMFIFLMAFPHSSYLTYLVDGRPDGVSGVVEQVLSFVLPEAGLSVFFFLSGYFFYTGSDNGITREWLKSKLSKRVKSILVPFVIWNLIYLGYVVIKHNLPLLLGGFPMDLTIDGLAPFSQWWRVFWDNADLDGRAECILGWTYVVGLPFLIPSWFLRDLMVVMLLSLLFWPLMRRKSGLVLLTLAFVLSLGFHFSIEGFSLNDFLPFLFGATLQARHVSLEKALLKLGRFLYLPWIALVFVCAWLMLDDSDALLILCSYMAIPSSYYLSTLAIRSGILSTTPFMNASLMFVYLAHGFIYPGISDRIIRPIISGSGTAACLMRFLLIPSLTMCLCFMVAWFFWRFAPRLFGVLSGGRSIQAQTELKRSVQD